MVLELSRGANFVERPLKKAAYRGTPSATEASKEKVTNPPGKGVEVVFSAGKALTGSVGLLSGQDLMKGAVRMVLK